MRKNVLEPLEPRRLLSAGVIDRSYGNNGQIVGHAVIPDRIDIGQPAAVDVATTSDGKTIVVGSRGDQGVFAARYDQRGRLDRSFGISGVFTLSLSQRLAAAAVAIDSRGRIVIAATAGEGSPSREYFEVIRLTPSGKLDPQFDHDGISVAAFPSFFLADAHDVAISGDDRIVVAGSVASEDQTINRLAVARFTTSGKLDHGFSVDGLQTVAVPGIGVAKSVAVMPDGRVVLGGNVLSVDGHSEFTVVRLTITGQLDGTFGADGIAMVQFSDARDDTFDSMLVAANGQVILAGRSLQLDLVNSGETFAAVARLNSDGTSDTSFGGGDGKTTSSDWLAPAASLNVIGNEPVVVAFASGGYRIIANGDEEFRLHQDGSFASAVGALLNLDGTSHLVGAAFEPDGSYILATTIYDPAGQVASAFLKLYHVRHDGTVDLRFAPDYDNLALPQGISGATVTADGKFVAAGFSEIGQLLYRFTADGALDSSFAHGGKAVFPLAPGYYSDFGGPVLLPFSDGRVLAAFSYTQDDGDSVAATFWRIESDGTIDPNYPDEPNFYGPIPQASGNATINVLAGDIVVATYDFFPAFQDRDGVIILPNGTFHNGNIPLARINEYDQLLMEQIFPVGKRGELIVSGREKFQDGSPDRYVLARYTSSGSLDTSFGGGQGVINGKFDAVAAQSNGQVLYLSAGSVRRLKANGSPDPSFGAGGAAAPWYQHYQLDNHDRIIAWKIRKDGDVQIARFTANGKSDKSFSGDGQVIVHLPVKGDVNLLVTSTNDLVLTSLARSGRSTSWSATRILG